jgi:DNA-binding NtrC family response regulator
VHTETDTILLVEDEAAVRALLSTVLTRSGYCVVTAESSNHAIVQAASIRGPIRLVITDVMLPTGTGAHLAAKLSAGGLSAPVLFISGYAAPMLIRQGHLQETSHFLQKPFMREQLLATVRELIAFARAPIERESAACTS